MKIITRKVLLIVATMLLFLPEKSVAQTTATQTYTNTGALQLRRGSTVPSSLSPALQQGEPYLYKSTLTTDYFDLYVGSYTGPVKINTRWFTGSGSPSTMVGSNGDFYIELDSSSGNGYVFQKAGGTWGSHLGSLLGPTGPAGSSGTGSGLGIEVNGTSFTSRSNVNFIPGTNVTITGADDSTNNRTNVTINSTASGSSGVSSLNSFTGTVLVNAGTGITVNNSSGNITVNSTASVNSIVGPVGISAGTGIGLSTSGSNITISNTGTIGGVSSVNSGTGAISITGTSGQISVSTAGSSNQIGLATSGVTAGTYNGVVYDAYGRATSGSNIIASQTGNSGKFLTTNGTTTSWGTPSGSGSSYYQSLSTSTSTSGPYALVSPEPGLNFIAGTNIGLNLSNSGSITNLTISNTAPTPTPITYERYEITATGNLTGPSTTSVGSVDYFVTATTANITLTLPTAASCYSSTGAYSPILRIFRCDSTSFTVTIIPNSAVIVGSSPDTISGNSSRTLASAVTGTEGESVSLTVRNTTGGGKWQVF